MLRPGHFELTKTNYPVIEVFFCVVAYSSSVRLCRGVDGLMDQYGSKLSTLFVMQWSPEEWE